MDLGLAILRDLAEGAAKRQKGYQRYNLVSIVEDLGEILNDGDGLPAGGHSAEHLAKFFEDDPTLHIPKIYWDLTTSRILTVERIRGSSILELQSRPEVDKKELALRRVNVWLTMLFQRVAFHVDPHPGNLFLEADGRLALIDFGMVGMVNEEMLSRAHLRQHNVNRFPVRGVLPQGFQHPIAIRHMANDLQPFVRGHQADRPA